ncbi:MAG: polysaccharide biosynthesis protein, partial [Pseudomonadota bacterium]
MNFQNKKILIIGGTGSLGRALIRRLSEDNEIIVYSRDEAKHWTIRNQLTPKQNVQFEVGDIRDANRVEEIILKVKPHIILIAAALKQVDTCERSPFESIQTNTLGIHNVINAVVRQEDRLTTLETVLMVSTDKACAPTNVYGMCKAISERVVTSQSISGSSIKFVGVRYGNVLESRGSIIPLFRWQADHLDLELRVGAVGDGLQELGEILLADVAPGAEEDLDVHVALVLLEVLERIEVRLVQAHQVPVGGGLVKESFRRALP